MKTELIDPAIRKRGRTEDIIQREEAADAVGIVNSPSCRHFPPGRGAWQGARTYQAWLKGYDSFIEY